MIVIKKNELQSSYVLVYMKSGIMIKPSGKIERKLPKIPLSDICILTYSDTEDVKKNLNDIQPFYDYDIIKLMLDSSMGERPYFIEYKLISFESAFFYNIRFDPDNIDTVDDSAYIPISLASLIFFLSEERMMNTAKVYMKVFEDDNGVACLRVIDLIEYYEAVLKTHGVKAKVEINQQADTIDVRINRELTDKTQIQ